MFYDILGRRFRRSQECNATSRGSWTASVADRFSSL